MMSQNTQFAKERCATAFLSDQAYNACLPEDKTGENLLQTCYLNSAPYIKCTRLTHILDLQLIPNRVWH